MEENQNQNPTPIREYDENRIVFFAETNFRNKRTKFGIKKDDRRRHVYIIGKTGMGKSNMMENMIIQDIVNGEGVALVDPHGDFAEKIIDFVPSHRINDVIYLNPADIEYPIAFNVMESVSQEHKHLVASGLVGVFKKLWADSWGPRLEYILRNAILALLDYPGSTLLGVNRMFVDKTYRNKVIEKIKDPVVKAFWIEEYSKYSAQFATEAVASIQNKIGQFLSTALIRNVVGQVKSSIDIREIMDNRKILIMNLSKGRIGEDASSLLGAMMITKIQLAAMSRIDIEESDRKDFYLYVDEFQNFATESFATILSEARKYRLCLIIGHQYIEQLEEQVRAAVFGNVGSLICFRVGSADAEFLKTEFAPYFTEEDLVNLTKYTIYLKLMIDGVASSPFSATTLPPLGAEYRTNNKEKVIKVSRERYATPRDEVEDKISRWSGVMENGELDVDTTEKSPRRDKDSQFRQSRGFEKTDFKNNSDKPRRTERSENPRREPPRMISDDRQQKREEKSGPAKQTKEKKMYQVICHECGKETEVNFKPDGKRPIYCQDCFQKIRNNALRVDTVTVPVQEKKVKELSLKEMTAAPLSTFEGKIKKPAHKKVSPEASQEKDGAKNKEPERDKEKINLKEALFGPAVAALPEQKTVPSLPSPEKSKPEPASQNIPAQQQTSEPKIIGPGAVVKF